MQTRQIALACAALLMAGGAAAQQKAGAPRFSHAPGKTVLLGKCFQCHTPAMWMDHRQDRRGWDSTLYRMVGRGALWTEDEIQSMADYLRAASSNKPPCNRAPP